MSHLRKLSARLGKNPIPASKPILPLLPANTIKLEFPSHRHPGLTKLIKDYQIPCMLLTASEHGLASLSASQLGFDTSAFVLHKNLELDRWSGYKASVEDYHTYINSSILGVGQATYLGLERCASLPNIYAQVERHDSIKVEYLNLQGEYVEEEMRGFKARVFLHEHDHDLGFLITAFRVSLGRIFTDDPKKNQILVDTLVELKGKIAQGVEKYKIKTREENKKYLGLKPGEYHEYVRKALGIEFESEFRKAILAALTADAGGNNIMS